MEDSFIELLIENFKIERVLNNILDEMYNSNDSNIMRKTEKYIRQINWFKNKNKELKEKNNIEITNLEGQKYKEGLAVEVLNKEDLNVDEDIIISQMIEPIVMKDGNILKLGKIIIEKENSKK